MTEADSGAALGEVVDTVTGAGVERRHAHPVPLMISRALTHRDATRTRLWGLRVIMLDQKKADWAAGGIGLPA